MSDILKSYVLAVRHPDRKNKIIGTAFLVTNDNPGYAVTCYHVVKKLEQIELWFPQEDRVLSAEVDTDMSFPDLDIAILRIVQPCDGIEVLDWSDTDCDTCDVIGYGFIAGGDPHHLEGKIKGTIAIPNKLRKNVKSGELIQLGDTFDVFPGMSGSPLIEEGTKRVVGMIHAGYATERNLGQDLAYALSVKPILGRLPNAGQRTELSPRSQWLLQRNFKPGTDPFRFADGSRDPHLDEYFSKIPGDFDRIRGKIGSPEVLFVFGEKGSGKSSLRRRIKAEIEDYGGLPVVYDNFSYATGKLRYKHDLDVGDHVQQLIKLCLKALIDWTKNDIWPSNATNGDSSLRRDMLWMYAKRHEKDQKLKGQMRKLLQPSEERREFPHEDFDHRSYLGYFSQLVKEEFEFKGVYFLIDPDDDVHSDSEFAWRVLLPLVEANSVLKLHEYDVAFKFFLNERFRQRCLEIEWIQRDIVETPLEWDGNTLRNLLSDRVGLSRVPIKRFEDLAHDIPGLDDQLIEMSNNRPRELIRLCDELLQIHCTQDLVAEEIQRSDVDTLIQNNSSSLQPKSEIELLIDSGESESLEFKSTMRYNLHSEKRDSAIEEAIAKAICGFMNASGGTLIIGVGDDREAVGLEYDFKSLMPKSYGMASAGQKQDMFHQAFQDLLEVYLGREILSEADLKAKFERYKNGFVYVVLVYPANAPVYLQGGQFFVRTSVGARTKELNMEKAVEYIITRFENHIRVILTKSTH